MTDTHYFVSTGMGWATAPTRKEAIEKLVNMFRREVKNVTANLQKKGDAGCYLWSCRVNAPQDAKYSINFFQPEGVEIEAAIHHQVTYVSKNHIAYTSETEMGKPAHEDEI